MHEIQKHILKKLSLNKNARYSDLKPKTVEGNIFVYHLKTLIKEGFVISESEKYRLTSKGKNLVDRVSFETFRERIQPKIVTLAVVEDKKGNYLFYRRGHAPFIGKIGFPYGKIHLEERLIDAASRELKEKTGLDVSLKHRGDVYLTVFDETELITHMLCHVFVGKNPNRILQSSISTGECFWEDLNNISQKDLIPGVKQITNLLKKSKNLFFAEYFLNVSDNE